MSADNVTVLAFAAARRPRGNIAAGPTAANRLQRRATAE